MARAPSIAALQRQLSERGQVKATDGCWTDPDGTCEHGAESWLLELGLI